jgi:hypothetical protein
MKQAILCLVLTFVFSTSVYAKPNNNKDIIERQIYKVTEEGKVVEITEEQFKQETATTDNESTTLTAYENELLQMRGYILDYDEEWIWSGYTQYGNTYLKQFAGYNGKPLYNNTTSEQTITATQGVTASWGCNISIGFDLFKKLVKTTLGASMSNSTTDATSIQVKTPAKSWGYIYTVCKYDSRYGIINSYLVNGFDFTNKKLLGSKSVTFKLPTSLYFVAETSKTEPSYYVGKEVY